jgi:hypothetical protein
MRFAKAIGFIPTAMHACCFGRDANGGDEFTTNGAGHAGNGNNGTVTHLGLLRIVKAIKKPRTFIRRGFGYGDAAVDLRAHDSRSPLGLCGFGHGFRGVQHRAGPYGPTNAASTAFAAGFGA